jgi:hypothetical protein
MLHTDFCMTVVFEYESEFRNQKYGPGVSSDWLWTERRAFDSRKGQDFSFRHHRPTLCLCDFPSGGEVLQIFSVLLSHIDQCYPKGNGRAVSLAWEPGAAGGRQTDLFLPR